VANNVADVRAIEQLQKVVALARSLPFPVDLWWVQTLCYEWIGQANCDFLSKADPGDKHVQVWISQIAALSEQLLFSRPGKETVESLPHDLLSKGTQNVA
jgi:hypothetical protein